MVRTPEASGAPGEVRQLFALANPHMQWELNDLARRLDIQPAAVELREGLVPVPASSASGLTPDGLAASMRQGRVGGPAQTAGHQRAYRQGLGPLAVGVLATSSLKEQSRGRRPTGARTARRDFRLRFESRGDLRRLPRALPEVRRRWLQMLHRRGGARCTVSDARARPGSRLAADPGL